MGAYTWLADSEFEKYTKVTDKEVNEILQEVRAIMPNIYVSERRNERKKYKYFGELIVTYSYTVYVNCQPDSPEVRVMSLNFTTSAHLFNYLCGLINGYKAIHIGGRDDQFYKWLGSLINFEKNDLFGHSPTSELEVKVIKQIRAKYIELTRL